MQKAKRITIQLSKALILISGFMVLFNLIVWFGLSSQKIKVSREEAYASGASGTCVVSVVNEKNGQPLISKVNVNLLDGKKKFVKKLFDGKTKEDGTIEANFDMPIVKEGDYYLKVKASSNFKSDTIYENINVLGAASLSKATISLDKLLYKPGDQVNYRALLTNNKDDSPVQTEAKVLIYDGNENQVYSRDIKSSQYGIISGSFKIADQVNTGTYKIKVEYGKTSVEKCFEVKPYTLPKFKVAIETDKNEYLLGQTINGKVKAYYTFGGNVKSGTVSLKLNGTPVQNLMISNGVAAFQIPVTSEGKQEISVSVTDSSNNVAEGSKGVFSGKDKIVVKFVPENKELVPGINNNVYIFTSRIDGTPVKTYITLTGDKTKQVSTDENGIGRLTVTPESTFINNYFQHKYSNSYSRSAYGNLGDEVPAQTVINTINEFGNAIINKNKYENFNSYSSQEDMLKPNDRIDMLATYIINQLIFDPADGSLSNIEYIKLDRSTSGESAPREQTIEIRTDGEPCNKYSFKAEIADEKGNILAHKDCSLPVKGLGLIVRTDKPIYSVNEKLNLDISSNIDNGTTHITICKNGQILKSINTDQESLEVQLPKDTYGLIDVYAERQGNSKDYSTYYSNEKVDCFKSVFIRPNKKMNLTINKEDRLYKPGEDLQLSFNVADGNGNPLNSAIMLSIVDEAMSVLKQNDMSLDNIRLALSGIDLGETVNGMDLYTAILNNAPSETLTALLLQRNSQPSQYLETNFDNIQKKQTTWTNLIKWFVGVLILVCLWLFISYKWFRFSVLHFIGMTLAAFAAIFIFRPDDFLRLAGTVIVSVIVYFAAARGLNAIKNDDDKKTLQSPVLAGAALLLLLVFAVCAMEYIMPMFYKNQELASVSGSQMDMMAEKSIDLRNDGPNDLFSSSSNLAGERGAVQQNSGSNSYSKSAEEGQGQSQKTDFAEIQKIRTQFLESMYFNPQIIAQAGKASINIPLADNITTWRIQAVANSINGIVGSGKESIKVLQDFFLDFEMPKNLTVGDEVSVPVTVFNYLDKSQNVKISVHTGDWFTLAGENNRTMTVNAKSQKLIYIPIKVNKFGDYSLRIDAFGQVMSDAVQKDAKVYPNGIRMQEVCASGNIEKKAEEKVFFLDKDIEGTRKIRIKVYPTPAAQVIEGLEGILQMPSGCFEQTSSTLYPDILALKYLKDTKKSNSKLEAKANNYIEQGFQKLLTYEVKDQRGGFSLFGESPAEIVLTAYGIMEFNDLKEVYPLDENILNRMKAFVFSKQQLDGSFSIDGYHIGGASSGDKLALNAYVGWALSQSSKDDKRLKKTVEYLKKKAENTEDAYTLSLIANVLVNAKDRDAKKVLDRLANKITLDNGKAYLSSNIRDYYGSYGTVQDLQTTALASIALTNSNLYQKTNKQMLSYIISNKDASGTFGTTQATILCLKALIENGRKGQVKDGFVVINVNGKEEKIEMKADNPLSYYEKEFDNARKDNVISLSSKSEVAYEIVKDHYLPFDSIKNGNSFEISRNMPGYCKVNDQVTEKIRIRNNQNNSVENFISEIQIPQGFTVDENSLEALKVNGIIEKYEMGYEKVNLYMSNFQPSEVKNIDIRFRACYPVNITSGYVKAYDYYNPSVEARIKPIKIKVTQ